MSHFGVLVFTDKKPEQDELEAIMMPWHEYECTGYEEYLEDVDITDEVMESWNKPFNAVLLSDGTYHWRHEFYQLKDPTDRFGPKEFKLPENGKEIELTAEQAREYGLTKETLKEHVKDEYGRAFERDGRWYRKTNSNAKWDWWTVGGRWTGFLTPKYDPADDPNNYEICFLCEGTGQRNDEIVQGKCNGCNGTGKALKHAPKFRRVVGDQVQWKDVPIEALRDDAEEKALKTYDLVNSIAAGRKWPDWNEIRERHLAEDPEKGIDKARREYNDHPIIKDLRENEQTRWLFSLDEYAKPREQYCIEVRRMAVVPHAIVKDGKWYENGEMGWWGVKIGDDDNAWEKEVSKLYNELSPETWVTVIDCHI